MLISAAEGLFLSGGIGYTVLVPLLRVLATLLMAISTYQLLKMRDDPHKVKWMIGIILAPIPIRILYEIYRRFIYIDKHNESKLSKKSSNRLLFWSIILSVLVWILSLISMISMGAGYLKGVFDGDYVTNYHDIHGTEYISYMDVPLYDREGNTYMYEPEWFVPGDYMDANGDIYENERSYLDEDGYFYYDTDGKLTFYHEDGYYRYYTDGEKLYFSLESYVYWDEDGVMYDKSGKYSQELFDFD